MSYSLSASGKSVYTIFSESENNKLVIPEFQRPYEWKQEHVEALFDDIWNHSLQKTKSSYFLGPIVTYQFNNNDETEYHIVDGQQRITTLALLLRAIYTALEEHDKRNGDLDDELRDIKTALWSKDDNNNYRFDVNPIETRVIDKSSVDAFNHIMETGNVDGVSGPYSESYVHNYLLLQKKFSEAMKEPLEIRYFIKDLLRNTILLPIITDSMDAAMDIFDTLNGRGMQLTDSDIFKSRIYGKMTDEIEKGRFINEWKKLESDCTEIGMKIQDLFTYYSFYLRAKNGEKSSSLTGIRKFYLADNRLFEKDLMENLRSIFNIYAVIDQQGYESITLPDSEDTNSEDVVKCVPKHSEGWMDNLSIRKSLDILSSFANEYWNYPVVTYYMANKGEAEFEDYFDKFLHKLIVELIYVQMLKSNVNALKTPIMNLNINSISNLKPEFPFERKDLSLIDEYIVNPHSKLERMILKILAYEEKEQKDVIAKGWEVEHIFPQKWDDSYYSAIPKSEMNELIEQIGNKMPLEKKLNIRGSNGFFSKKVEEYLKSSISMPLNMSKRHNWDGDSIKDRNDALLRIFKDAMTRWDQPL